MEFNTCYIKSLFPAGHSKRYVQTAKNLLKKCYKDNTDILLALLLLRNTPISNTLKSPNQRLMSRITRSTMPCPKDQLKPSIENVASEIYRSRKKQHEYANIGTKKAPTISIGDKVQMQTNHRNWCNGTVINNTPYPRSLMVQTANGSIYRRNTHHLRKTRAEIPTEIALSPTDNAHPEIVLAPPPTNRRTSIHLPNEETNLHPQKWKIYSLK